MKNFKFMFGILVAALAMMLPGQSVSGAEAETGYSYDTIEFVCTDEKVEAIAGDIPGTDLDETMALNVAATFSTAANTSYSYDTIELELTSKKAGAIGVGVPGTDLDEIMALNAAAAEESVSKQYDVDVVIGSSVIVRVSQMTNWTYAPGISSTLKGYNVLYQNVKAGYAIESGGSTKTTNNDGSQQIADYFRIFAPDGTYSNWYRVLSVCSVNGVVSSSIKLLDY